jgi:hypothetical protein
MSLSKVAEIDFCAAIQSDIAFATFVASRIHVGPPLCEDDLNAISFGYVDTDQAAPKTARGIQLDRTSPIFERHSRDLRE